MKLNLLLILSLSFIIGCSSPDKNNKSGTTESEQKELQSADHLKPTFAEDITAYFTAFNNADWNAVNEMIYPRLFELITKEQMVQTFTQMEENGMEMKTKFQKIDSLSSIISHEGSQYCRIYYDGDIKIGLSGEMLESLELIKTSFIEAYGEENVKYDEAKSQFDIKAIKSMLAIKSTTPDHWTYIEYTGPKDQVIQQLIPQEVLNHLGS